jgi:hypothetical protein
LRLRFFDMVLTYYIISLDIERVCLDTLS